MVNKLSNPRLGFVPSLEALPLFESSLRRTSSPFLFAAYSSYGEIARGLLTGDLAGGVLPWEIFISEVLALPGQRAMWAMPALLQPGPIELLLREPLFKMLYPCQKTSPPKLPARMNFAVESGSSLTRIQLRAWLSQWTGGSACELTFQVLPMHLMFQGMAAEVVDGIIATAPWGMDAETKGRGKVDNRFSPGPLGQQIALVCNRDLFESHGKTLRDLASALGPARMSLKCPVTLLAAAEEMGKRGRPKLHPHLLERAVSRHAFHTARLAEGTPDIDRLLRELKRLDQLSILPPQIAATEQTARLLAC